MTYQRLPADECSICLEPLKQPLCWCFKPNITRASCGHKFHTKCIANWTSIHHRCPMCSKHIGRSSFGPENFYEEVTLVAQDTSHITIMYGFNRIYSFTRRSPGVWESLSGDLLLPSSNGLYWGAIRLPTKPKSLEKIKDIIQN